MSSQTWVFRMDLITIKAHQILPQTASTNKFSFHDEKLLPRFTNFPRFYYTRHAKLSPFCIFLAESWNGRKGYLRPPLFEVKYWVWKKEEFEEKIAKIVNDVNCSPFYPVPYFSDSDRMFVILVYAQHRLFTIKTPNLKCWLYWCLIEFID